MDAYQQLAKKSIDYFLKSSSVLDQPDNLPNEMTNKQAGVFVSLHTKEDELRGCIGTFLPTQDNIAQEIINNALSASFHDPRFIPITKSEFDNLKIKVDVLTEPEITKSKTELDPKKYGILIKAGNGRSGLLLPDLEGINTIEKQVNIACQKGGIDPESDSLNIYKFKVIRHG